LPEEFLKRRAGTFVTIEKNGELRGCIGTYPNQENVVFDDVIPYKTGLLLPDLDGVDTVEKQIAIACQKGGIDQKTKIFIYKFTVEKF